MALDFDVQGALAAGYTLPQIADYLGQRSQFDVAAARKSGYSDVDIVGSLAGSDAVEGLKGGTGNLSRGAQTALGQTVPTLKGVVGLIGATAEQNFGEGGVSTALKNWGLNGYKAGMEKIQPLSRDTDELTTALDKAKQGNLGALIDWATWAIGYGSGQLAQSAAMAAVGGIAGAAMAPEAAPVTGATGAVTGLLAPGAVKGVAQSLIEKAVVKEANRLMAESGGKLAAEAATKQATKAVASSIGKGGALLGYETGMELGSIYADAEAQARKEGRQLDGADLARVWGTGILAGGVGAVGDKIGLDAVTGKLSSALPGGRLARTVGGAMAAGTSNSAEEGVQTMLERVGAGKEVFSPEGVKDIVNSMGAGFMGSAPAGAFGGIISRQRQDLAVEKGKTTLDQDLSVGGAQKAIDAAAAELRGATDAYLGVPPAAPAEPIPAAPQGREWSPEAAAFLAGRPMPAVAPAAPMGEGGLLPAQVAAQKAMGVMPVAERASAVSAPSAEAPAAAPIANVPAKPSGRPWSPEAAEFLAESATGQPGGATPEQQRLANLRTMADRDAALAQQESAAGTQFERDQAAAQRAVNLEKRAPAKVGEASNLVDLTPMTSKEAMNRLSVLRDMIANEGGNALGLAIVPHPRQKGKFAIGQRELPSLKLDPIEQPVNEAETQARLETAALTGKEQGRRAEDKQRQELIARVRASIEARGGVASPYEAEVLREANQGKPYDRIDPSLGRQASPDQLLTARTGILVGSEAGLGYGAQESKTPRQEAKASSNIKVNQRQRATASDEATVAQARLEHAAAQGRLAAAQTNDLQQALARPAGENPVEALRNVQGGATTQADVQRLIDAANERRDAAETAEIERMLAEDAAQAKADANAVAIASRDETAQAKAREIAAAARRNLVDHLLERYAEPNNYFASAVIKAINKQLSVLQREPLTAAERARIEDLLARTRAFLQPNLPADKAAPAVDRGADNSSMERLIKPQPTAESIAQKEDQLQVQRTLKGYEAGQRPADPLSGIKGETTTQADVQRLVDSVRSEKDAAETAEIERMLAEDAKVEKAKADAVRQASDDETSRAKAQDLADAARRKLVDHLVERFAEPNGYFASGVIQAVNKQLSVLGREPLSKGERARIDDLLGRTRAFLQPNLPTPPEKVVDRGADNATMESLIPERGAKSQAGTPKPTNKAEYEAEVRRQLGDLQPGDTLENDMGDVWTVDAVLRNKAGEIVGVLPRERSGDTSNGGTLDLQAIGSILMPSPYTDANGNRRMSQPGKVNRSQTQKNAQPVPAASAAQKAGGSPKPKVPRPSKVGGVPTAQLTDEQLSATAGNDQLPAITRRGATVELQAREEERQAQAPVAEKQAPVADVFATKAEAKEAQRQQPDMRVVATEGGYTLAPKTEAQIAAYAAAARRFASDVGANGGPLNINQFIAHIGGLPASEKSELGIEKNVRLGPTKWLFGKDAMPMDRVVQALREAGYLKTDDHNEARDLIQRTLRGDPQYTPEGWDRIAEAEAQSRYEDHLEAQREEAAKATDEWTPEAIMAEDMQAVPELGRASEDLKAEVAALLDLAESHGIDRESLLERAAIATENGTENDYYQRAKENLQAAITQSDRSRSDAADGSGAQGRPRQEAERGSREAGDEDPGRPGYALEQPTREDVVARQDQDIDTLDDLAQIRRESEAGAGLFDLKMQDGRQDTTGSLFSTQRDGDTREVKADGETHSYTVVKGLTNQPGLTKVLREIARVFGKQVVFFQSDTLKADGFVNPGNSRDIHINADSKMSPVAVLGHELMHLFKLDNPVAYRAIATVLTRQVDEKGRALFRADYGRGANMEELSADLLGNAFQDPGFLSSVFAEIGATAPQGQARSIVQRLVSALSNAIAAALKVIQGMGVQPGFKADMIVKDLQAVRSALRLAMVEYGKGQREQAQGVAQKATSSGDMVASRPRGQDQTETPAFKRWFKDSKVVDADGKPLVVYHGGVVQNADGIAIFRPGSHFGTLEQAYDAQGESYRNQRRLRPDLDLYESTYPVYLSIQNPYRSDDIEDGWNSVIERAKRLGHDGIVYLNRYEGDGESDSWIIFNPEQVKSATGNNGEFDPANPDITMSRQRNQDDLFPEDFATKRTTVSRQVAVDSRGNTKTIKLKNVNSQGQQISPTVQGLDNFWDWYADGPVDEKGRPILMYHSTNGDITEFEVGRQTSNYFGLLGNVDVTRAGIFATPDNKFSQDYLKDEDGGNVMQVYMALQNPIDLRGGLTEADESALEQAGLSWDFLRVVKNDWSLFDNEDDGSNKFVEALKRAGYDGAIITEDSPTGDTDGGDTYIAFDPAQIKSATGNQGTFDPANPDITMSRQRGQDQTETPAFKRWFKDSKVVDADGKPLVVYHGSRFGGFSVFMRSAGGFIYTTPSAEYASSFSGGSEGSAVYPVYVSVQNPLDLRYLGERTVTAAQLRDFLADKGVNLDAVEQWEGGPVEQVKLYGEGPAWRLLREDGVSLALEKAGYDGAILREGDGQDAYLAFRPEQIKSAIGNNGEFDPANPDITMSRQRQTETPEFKRWFGNSKMLDGNGNPKVYYHATPENFSEFKAGGKDARLSGHAIWLSPYADHQAAAHNVGGAKRGFAEGTNVMPLYVKMERPLVIDDKVSLQWAREVFAGGSQEFPQVMLKEWADEVQRDGEYDGIVFDGEALGWGDRSGEILVFKSSQIKSAIGNNGEFDPANPDITMSRQRIFGDNGRQRTPEQLQMMRNIGRSVEELTIKERIASLRQDLGKKLVQGIVDQFAPLKEISTKAYQLARLSKGASGAMEAMLHHGKLSIRDGVYDADMSGGVLERLGVPLHGEFDDFLNWVAGHRAERLMAEGRENLFSRDDIIAAKTLADDTTNFDYTLQHGPNAGQVTRDRSKIYDDALKTFNEFNKNALDIAEQSGLIDPEARKVWENEFYVPFYRVSEEGFMGDTLKNGLVRQQVIATLKGGTDKLNDLMSNTLLNWAHLIDAAAKNRAALASLDSARQMGLAIEASEDVARQMAKAMGIKSQVVWAMDGGKRRFFVVEDKAMLQAITSLQYAGLKGPLMDAMGAFKHALTIGVTASPAFKIRNLARDSVQAIASAPLSYNLFKNLAEGYQASDPKGQTYVSALASGGLIRFGTMIEGNEAARTRRLVKMGVKDSTILNSKSKIDALWTKIEKGFMAYQELGNRGEEINRAALYKQLIDQGVPHGEAALQARDLMDFSLQGTFTTVRFLSQVVPFLNARLQGLYKLGRAGKEDPRRFAAVLGSVALASVALMLAYQDDDKWKEREPWDRNNYWWFKFGGEAFRIPKPFEIGAMATLAERGLEYFINPEMTGRRLYENVRDILMDQLSMNPIPQAVKPILDIYSNKDSFSGRPIESMGMDRLRPDYRYTINSSMLARGVSTAGQAVASQVNGQFLSPVQIDHLLHGYFSWLGAFVVGASDMALRPLTGQPERPTADFWKVATQGIVQDANSPQSRYVSQMYQQAKEVEQAYSTWNMLRKQGRLEEADQFLTDNAETIQKYRRVEMVKERETKLNERIRMIERSAMSADDKKAQISELQAMRNETARLLAQ